MTEYKIVVLGAGGVGKSALTVQFTQNVFVTKYEPTIEDSYRKIVEVDGEQVILEILDTAGTEQFTAMRDLYIKGGDGFVLAYSVIAKSTVSEVVELHDIILKVKDRDVVPIVLVGNKCDLQEHRQVSTSQGEDMAKQFKCKYLETSALNRKNIDELFYELVRAVRKSKPKTGKKKAKHCTLI